MSEGAGFLGFAKPVETNIDKIAQQVTRLQAGQNRTALSQQRYIQRVQEQQQDDIRDMRQDIRGDVGYSVSHYGGQLSDVIRMQSRKDIEEGYKYADQGLEPPIEWGTSVDANANAVRGFDGQTFEQQKEFKKLGYIETDGLIDMYMSHITAGYNENKFSPFDGTAPTLVDFYKGLPSSDRIDFIKEKEYWTGFFEKMSKTTVREGQEGPSGGQTTSATINKFTKPVNGKIVALSPEEILEQGLLQAYFDELDNLDGYTILQNAVERNITSSPNQILSFTYDSDEGPREYRQAYGEITNNDAIGMPYMFAQALSEAATDYAIISEKASVTTKVKVNTELNREAEFNKNNRYDINQATKINDIVLGHTQGVKSYNKGVVRFDVTGEFDTLRYKNSDILKMYYVPENQQFEIVPSKGKIGSGAFAQQVEGQSIFLSPYEVLEQVQLGARGNQEAMLEVLDRKGIGTSPDTYNPNALHNGVGQYDVDAEGFKTIIKERVGEALEVENPKKGLSAVISEFGHIPTADGDIINVKRVGDIYTLKFEGGQQKEFNFEELKTYMRGATRSVSAIGADSQRVDIEGDILDILNSSKLA
jgi:hypothetical protein